MSNPAVFRMFIPIIAWYREALTVRHSLGLSFEKSPSRVCTAIRARMLTPSVPKMGITFYLVYPFVHVPTLSVLLPFLDRLTIPDSISDPRFLGRGPNRVESAFRQPQDFPRFCSLKVRLLPRRGWLTCMTFWSQSLVKLLTFPPSISKIAAALHRAFFGGLLFSVCN